MASLTLVEPGEKPVLDPDFRPPVLANRRFKEEVEQSGSPQRLGIVLERPNNQFSRCEVNVFDPEHPRAPANFAYVERLVKFLLWQKGGFRMYVAGPAEIVRFLTYVYSNSGPRAFDADFMGRFVYESEFEVIPCSYEDLPEHSSGGAQSINTDWKGWRIGFDLGASDRKVALVKDGELAVDENGEPILSEEYEWSPKEQTDPAWHYEKINEILKTAADKVREIDPDAKIEAIGGSAAGIYVENTVRIASILRGVKPRERFEKEAAPIFLKMQEEWENIPFRVENDGDVSALAGATSLGQGAILGIAMGSSLAAGYVDDSSNVPGWLNELAFAPVDYNPYSPVDEWSGEYGVGALYFSQQAVGRLIPEAGIEIPDIPEENLPDRLVKVQEMAEKGDERAMKIYDTIGTYLGYTLPLYYDFYQPLRHVEVLGRVTTGEGGETILKKAREVLDKEFPQESKAISFYEPDEREKRHGQAAAAAHLPVV